MPEEKTSEAEKKPETGEKKEVPDIKNKRKKFCCCLGGAALLILVLIFIFNSSLIRGFFGSSASDAEIDRLLQSKLQSPTPASSAAPSPTSAKTVTDAPATENYEEPRSCQAISMTSSVPLSISTDNPGVNQDVVVHYYDIYGFTQNDLRAQMTACGPKQNGEPYDAYASWYVNWRYNYQSQGGQCSLRDVTVGVKVDLTYPRWQTPASFQQGLLDKWQRYMANLETHENGHKQNGLDAGSEILNTLSSQASASSCDEAATLANDSGYAIISKYGAQDTAYDDSTNHGATQGATFP